MWRIHTNDGAVFTGTSANAVVRAMADAQWNAPDQKVEYKREVVMRVSQMTGHRLSQHALRDARRFLRFLEQCGLVIVERDVHVS